MSTSTNSVAIANWLVRDAAPLYLAHVGSPLWSSWLAQLPPITTQSLSAGTALRGSSGLLDVIASDLRHAKAAEHNAKADDIRALHHCSMDSMDPQLLGALLQAQRVFLPSKTGRRVRSIVEASAALLLTRANYEFTATINETAAEALSLWPADINPPTPHIRSNRAQ